MDKWNLIVDVALCENCHNCVLAAKDELVGNDFPGYSAPHAAQGPGVIRIDRSVRGHAPRVQASYLPTMCDHCDEGPCLQAGADGSVRKRDDGIVVIDPVKARGRRDLVDACPHGAIVWNEAEQLPQTWFFDAHLLDAGATQPRCVGVCPTQAIEAVKISDEAMAVRVRREGLRGRVPAFKPRVLYRHLDRTDHCFVAGSVSTRVGQRIECLQGAQVTLGGMAGEALTDAFGDFRIDGLPPRGGDCRLTITHAGHEPKVITVRIDDDSIDVGDVMLDAAPPRPAAAGA